MMEKIPKEKPYLCKRDGITLRESRNDPNVVSGLRSKDTPPPQGEPFGGAPLKRGAQETDGLLFGPPEGGQSTLGPRTCRQWKREPALCWPPGEGRLSLLVLELRRETMGCSVEPGKGRTCQA